MGGGRSRHAGRPGTPAPRLLLETGRGPMCAGSPPATAGRGWPSPAGGARRRTRLRRHIFCPPSSEQAALWWGENRQHRRPPGRGCRAAVEPLHRALLRRDGVGAGPISRTLPVSGVNRSRQRPFTGSIDHPVTRLTDARSWTGWSLSAVEEPAEDVALCGQVVVPIIEAGYLGEHEVPVLHLLGPPVARGEVAVGHG